MRAVAIICFFLSGASGLVFEVIWSRMFSLVFGATTLAIATVLTAFMGGLALGSYLAGRLADRLQDPLRAYALCEAGIGISALALPLVVAEFDGLNRLLYAHFGDNFPLLSVLRFVVSAAVLAVPTTLMGATLPLLSRYFVRTEAEHARLGLRVGVLYAVNTFGAVVGTSAGGFALLPTLGLSATNTLAAATNLTLAAVVMLAYQVRKRLPAPPPMDPEVAALMEEVGPVPVPDVEVSPRARAVAIAGFGFSGAVAMVYQQIWTRVLSMQIGSSVYSFTLVLVAFLVGLAGGAALTSRMASRARDPVGLLALNHLVIVLTVGISSLLVDKLPFVFLFFIRGETLGASTIVPAQFALALLTMLPATLAMGAVLPLTMRVAASGLASVGRDVGNVYAVNTVGAIFGSFLGGFFFIPVLQLQRGMYVAACVNLALAATLSLTAPWRLPRRLAGAGLAVTLAGAALLLPSWNLAHVSAGLFRLSIAREVLSSGKWKDPKLVYHRDGIVTTVTVEQWSSKHYSMKNNGKVDASTGDDMPTQIAVGLLPILLHPDVPRIKPKAALIGYASGVTAGAMLRYPLSRLTVVELEPAILEASAFFEHVNNRPMGDPRLRLVTDDGRNFLAAGTERYDVIVNEPSNPWITGVSNLFTREYFEIGKRRLRPGGIFCTWAQMYEISPRHIKSIYKTFSQVFPYTYAFSAEALSSDTFLIGSNRPLRPDIRRLRRAFAIPSVTAELKRAKVVRPDDLLALTLLGPGEVRAFTMGARVNTDDNALIEFGAPRDLLNHRQYDYYISRVYGQTWPYGRLEPFLRGYSGSEDHAALVHSLLRQGKFREATHFLEQVERGAGPMSLRVSRLMDLLDTHEVAEEEVALTEGPGGPIEPPRFPRSLLAGKVRPPEGVEDEEPVVLSEDDLARFTREYVVAEEYAEKKQFQKALDLIETWPSAVLEQTGNDFQLFWGFLVYKCRDFHTAVKILEPLTELPKYGNKRPALYYYLGRSRYGNADYAASIESLEAWIAHRVAVGRPVAPGAESEEPQD